MNRPLFVVAACCAFAQSSLAQTEYVSLWDNNFRYQVMRIIPWGSASRTNSAMGSGSVQYFTESWPTGFGPQTDPNNHNWASGGGDLYWACTQSWWFYRGVPGDTREYSLSNQTSYVQTAPGTVTLTYSEPVGSTPNALLFTLVYTLTGEIAGPGTAIVRANFTVQNTSAASLDVAFFHWADLDAGGLSQINNDLWSYTPSPDYSEYRITEAASPSTPFMTFGALGPVSAQNDRWGGNGSNPSFPRSNFLNTTIQDMPRLNSEASPTTTTGIAWSGGIEWLRTLAPGASFSGSVYIGYNTDATTLIPPACDPIDFNGDGLYPDTADIDDFLSVFSGGPCSTGTCGDTDFNNDGLFPDTLDIDSLLSTFSGGPCL